MHGVKMYLALLLSSMLFIGIPSECRAEKRQFAPHARNMEEGLVEKDRALAYISLIYAAEKGDNAVVRAWIARGVDVNGRNLDAEKSELAEAAKLMDAPVVVAAAKGHLDAVKILLAAKADPNRCCCSCVTALHRAIKGQHADIVKVLLDAGANPRALYDMSLSPLELAKKTGNAVIQKYIEESLARTPEGQVPKPR